MLSVENNEKRSWPVLSPVFGIACLMLGNPTTYASLASFGLRPNMEQRLGLLSATYYGGVLFGTLAYPALIRSIRDGKKFPALRWLAVAIFSFAVACLVAPGYEAWLRDGVLRYSANFATGMLLPISYFVFFATVPSKHFGVWFGAGISVGFVAWRATMLHALSLRKMPGADPMAGMDIVFIVHAGSIFALAALLLYALLFHRAAVTEWARPCDFASAIMPTRKNRDKILAAVTVLYLLNAIVDIRLFSAVKMDTDSAFTSLILLVILFTPFAGWLISYRPTPAWKWFIRSCSWIFIATPCLLLLGSNPSVYKLVHSLATLGQFTCTVLFSVVLASIMPNAIGATHMAAGIYFLKIVSVAGFALAKVFELGTGLEILIGTLLAFLFYHCVRRVEWKPAIAAVPPEEPMQPEQSVQPILRDNGTDLGGVIEAFIASRELSQRETEVANMVLRGASTRDIAIALGISEHTVKTHVKNILVKYNLPNRRALVAACFVASNPIGRNGNGQ